MKFIKLFCVTGILFSGTAAAIDVQCLKMGQIVSLDVFPTSVNIFIREGSLQNHVYYAAVNLNTDPNSPLPAIAASLLAAGHKVEVSASGVECPTTGTIRYIGDLQTLRAALIDPLGGPT